MKCSKCGSDMEIIDIHDHPRHGVKDIKYRCTKCGSVEIEEVKL